MRHSRILAFDDYLVGTATTYSSSDLNTILGAADSWWIQVVLDDHNLSTLDAHLETSADGRNWLQKNTTSEISVAPGAGTNVLSGSDLGTLGRNLGLVRLAVTGTQSLSSPKGHLRIWVTLGPRSRDFLPTDLSGCVLWLRSDLGVSVSAGSVTAWADQSGNAANAAQGTSTPTYNTTAGGLPRLSVAAGQYMTGLFATSVATHTLFLVVNYKSPLNNYAAFAATDGTFTVNSGFAQFVETPTGAIGRAGLSNTTFASAVTTAKVGAPAIYSSAADSNTTVDIYVNGNFGASTATPALTGRQQYLLFTLGGTPPTQYQFVGDAYEFIVYSSVLNVNDRITVHRYLGARYNIPVP